MSNKNRSCSMPKIQNNNYNYHNEYQNYQIDTYKKNDYVDDSYGLINFDCINHALKSGFGCEFKQTRTINKDGNPEITSSINIYKPQPKTRKIIKEETETKIVKKNDYEIITKQNCITTGLIFKDHHYYETQKIVPKPKYINKKRKVTYFDDGTINYGDWMRYN